MGHREDNVVTDVIGPEIYSFDEMVRFIAQKIGSKARIIHIKLRLALFLARLIGYVVKDVVITKRRNKRVDV